MPPPEEQQNSPEEEEQSLPTGAELLAEHITEAKETVRRIQMILEHIEHRRYDVLLFPSNVPLITHSLGLLMDVEKRFIENSRRWSTHQSEVEEED